MDLTNNTTTVKNQEQVEQIVAEIEVETPTNTHQIHKPKPFSTTNGVLKRKNPYTLPYNLHHPVVVLYKECLKNHAANIGGHAVDGCGEFMPSPTANPTDPTSLKCAACGCHRNFHKRDEPEELKSIPLPAIEYKPHHRHHPPPPLPPGGDHSGSPNDESPSPPPISSAYYPSSAPHMLLALSTGFSGEKNIPNSITRTPMTDNSNSRKRFRTKFTPDQKAKMMEFAEQVGWKMQKRDEDLVNKFCHEIGVEKGVLKVWMHNNKNTVGKKSDQPNNSDDKCNNNDNDNGIGNGNGNGNGKGNTNENYVNGFCIVSRNNTDSEFHKYENKKDDIPSQVIINHVVVTTNGSSTT